MAQTNWKCPDQWNDWSEWLAAGLHARNRWRLPVLLVGMLFANGRRTVTTWLRAAGITADFDDNYYLLAAPKRIIPALFWRDLPDLQSGDSRMVTETRKRKSTGSKKRFVGKPTGQIQQRVQDVGPEHFGIIAVDCAKRRSKWMLCNFFGKVLVEPTETEVE